MLIIIPFYILKRFFKQVEDFFFSKSKFLEQRDLLEEKECKIGKGDPKMKKNPSNHDVIHEKF